MEVNIETSSQHSSDSLPKQNIIPSRGYCKLCNKGYSWKQKHQKSKVHQLCLLRQTQPLDAKEVKRVIDENIQLQQQVDALKKELKAKTQQLEKINSLTKDHERKYNKDAALRSRVGRYYERYKKDHQEYFAYLLKNKLPENSYAYVNEYLKTKPFISIESAKLIYNSIRVCAKTFDGNSEVPRLKVNARPPKKKYLIQEAEAIQYLEELYSKVVDKELFLIQYTMFMTGSRINGVMKLTLGDCFFLYDNSKELFMPDSKTSQPIIEVSEELVALYKAFIASKGLFGKETRIFAVRDVNRKIKTQLFESSILTGKSPSLCYGPHCWRKSFFQRTLVKKYKGSLIEASKSLNHSSLQVSKKYEDGATRDMLAQELQFLKEDVHILNPTLQNEINQKVFRVYVDNSLRVNINDNDNVNNQKLLGKKRRRENKIVIKRIKNYKSNLFETTKNKMKLKRRIRNRRDLKQKKNNASQSKQFIKKPIFQIEKDQERLGLNPVIKLNYLRKISLSFEQKSFNLNYSIDHHEYDGNENIKIKNLLYKKDESAIALFYAVRNKTCIVTKQTNLETYFKSRIIVKNKEIASTKAQGCSIRQESELQRKQNPKNLSKVGMMNNNNQAPQAEDSKIVAPNSKTHQKQGDIGSSTETKQQQQKQDKSKNKIGNTNKGDTEHAEKSPNQGETKPTPRTNSNPDSNPVTERRPKSNNIADIKGKQCGQQYFQAPEDKTPSDNTPQEEHVKNSSHNMQMNQRRSKQSRITKSSIENSKRKGNLITKEIHKLGIS
jgi:hypothetical protein